MLEPVTNILQGISVDMISVQKHVNILLDTFKSHRESDLDSTFEIIFKSATEIAQYFNVDLKIPRIVNKQTYRANYDANSVIDYYKKSIFIPYLDSLLSSLNNRFSSQNNAAFLLYNLHPYYLRKMNKKEYMNTIKIIYDFYHIENFNEEAEVWYSYWNNNDIVITDETLVLDLLQHCQFFKAIAQTIEILICLPPTTCTIERSFSTLRRVKTWLRSTISKDRLNDLCMLSIHRAHVLTNKERFIESVLDEFSKKPRNLKFAFSE